MEKRLIFLKLEDINPDDIKMKPELKLKLEEKALIFAMKSFNNSMKEHKFINILYDVPKKPQVVIEFPMEMYHKAHDILRALEVVELIDPNLPLTESQIKIKNKAELPETDSEHLIKLKARMEKYKK